MLRDQKYANQDQENDANIQNAQQIDLFTRQKLSNGDTQSYKTHSKSDMRLNYKKNNQMISGGKLYG